MWSKNIVNFIGCDSEYEEADIVLYGAPFDSTTSFRPGARFGCQAVRAESFGLETYSPYQEKELTDGKVFDSGDPELPMGSTEESLRMIEERCAAILADGKLPFLIGGEHLVTLGAVRAAQKKYPDLAIIHLDAHADLREDYLGVKLSHACVMRRCWELVGDGSIWQLGIRSGDREEFRWAGEGHVQMSPFGLQDAKAAAEEFKGRPVYLTLDLDVLDHYNGTRRSIHTLSGGESFQASLSLALGLSDEIQAMSGGIRMEAMFVDEGFGTLDDEALDKAVRALASLSEGNKLVGIISHVSELKERIDKKILVEKEKGGESRAYVVIG